MTIQELREKAADLVEQGWTQGRWACTVQGTTTSPDHPAATCWCVYGALLAVAVNRGGIGDVREAVDQIRAELGLPQGTSLDRWNDAPGRTQGEVVRALRGVAV